MLRIAEIQLIATSSGKLWSQRNHGILGYHLLRQKRIDGQRHPHWRLNPHCKPNEIPVSIEYHFILIISYYIIVYYVILVYYIILYYIIYICLYVYIPINWQTLHIFGTSHPFVCRTVAQAFPKCCNGGGLLWASEQHGTDLFLFAVYLRIAMISSNCPVWSPLQSESSWLEAAFFAGDPLVI